MRRGVALDMAGVMSFEAHERLRRSLINALADDPPPGYAPASIAQLERADLYAFQKLAEYTREGLRGTIPSRPPLDTHLDRILDSSRYLMLLQPLASGRPAASSHEQQPAPARTKRAENDRKDAQIENLKRQVENLRKKSRTEPASSSGGRTKPKQRGKANRDSTPMPKSLQGHFNSTKDGPICFGFNLPAGCEDARTGGKCKRGQHVCCHRDCPDRASHGFASCPLSR